MTTYAQDAQQLRYKKIMAKHTFSDDVSCADWLKVDEIEGINYYTPNDEDWGAIIAVSHEHKLAHCTGFYEMDDMAADHGEYKQVVSNGEIMCNFEA